MRQENFTYKKIDSAFYETLRISKGSSTEWSAAKEGNALINPEKTPENYELVPHHEALDPSNYRKHNRGQGIAEYHKLVTGRAARMKGQEEQLSKAIGCIITLPRNYLELDYNLTDEEYNAIIRNVENGKKEKNISAEYKSAMDKIRNYEFTDEEKERIRAFFMSALEAYLKVAGIRRADLLYAVVHFDENFPHLHIAGLPTVEDKATGKITFSTSKYNNRVTGYFDTLHERVIAEMKMLGIDGSGLLNGATKGKGFLPADLDRMQREESVERSIENRILQHQNQKLQDKMEHAETALIMVEGQKSVAEQELEKLQNKKIANRALGKKEIQVHKKELQRIQKREGNPQITQYEYERLIQSAKIEKELQEELHKLSEKEKNFQQEVKKAAEAMFPEELKQVRKEKVFCDEWLARAMELEQQQIINFTKEMELAEKEEELAQRERTLNAEVEYHARRKAEELFQNQKASLLDLILDVFAVFISAIVEIISIFLPVAVMEKVTELVDNFRFNVERVFEEPEIEHAEQE